MPKRLVRAATVVAVLVALTACESSESSNGKKSHSPTPTQTSSTAASPQTRGTTSAPASPTPSTAPTSSESKAATSSPASAEASEGPTSPPAASSSRDYQSPSESPSSQSTGAFTTSVECTSVSGAESPVSKVVFRGNGTKYSARFVYDDDVETPPDTLGYVVTLFGEDGANGVLSAGHLNGKKVFPVEDDNFVVIEHGYLTIVEAYTRIPGITRPFSWYAEVKDTDNTIATCGTKTTAVSVD